MFAILKVTGLARVFDYQTIADVLPGRSLHVPTSVACGSVVRARGELVSDASRGAGEKAILKKITGV